MNNMIIRCLYDKLVPIHELKKRFHPKNRNQHPKEQIERLAKILNYQGVRYCAKISNRSGLITSGHGRVLAAEFNGWKEYPVNFQDYDSEDQEYADLQADNAVAAWAELDLSGINLDLGDLGPDFDIDLLGIKDFVIEPFDKFPEEIQENERDQERDDEDEPEDRIPERIEPRVKEGESYHVGAHQVLNGDCLKRLKELESNSIDSLVTDPPAGISFMGKEWDEDKGGSKEWISWLRDVMKECLRVLKPGSHGLVWAIPRTSHWTATALEEAGFEIRDIVTHLFGSGFPKSLDISKAIDKAAGAEREVIGSRKLQGKARQMKGGNFLVHEEREETDSINFTAPSTPEAKRWQGFGTALKPASEHWILIRKPLSEKTVASNVLKHGTGGINIDGCRIGYASEADKEKNVNAERFRGMGQKNVSADQNWGIQESLCKGSPQGRFPANLVLSHQSTGIFTLKCDIMPQARAVLEEYFNGYNRVSELQREVPNNAVSPQERTENERNSSSHQRHQVRQPHRESGLERSQESLNRAPGHREEILHSPQRERTLEVFVEDIPSQWLKYFEYSRWFGCVEVGQKKVKGLPEKANDVSQKRGKGKVGFASPDGTETVDAYECTEGCAVAELDRQSGHCGANGGTHCGYDWTRQGVNMGKKIEKDNIGGASRFFYCAKASKSERNAGCEGLPEKIINEACPPGSKGANSPRAGAGAGRGGAQSNIHPTVKPVKLMQYLVRLVTPPEGRVLDCFAGSGSTLVACHMNQFEAVLIEQSPEYCDIILARAEHFTEKSAMVQKEAYG